MQAALRGVPHLRVPRTPDGHAHYRCMAYAEPGGDEGATRRARMLAALARAKLPAHVGSCAEIYREPLFQQRGLAPRAALPVARELGQASLAFLVHHTIGADAMHAYAAAAAEALRSVDAGRAAASPRA
jgi:dTDP-4-amino-4,6-dideoxygalactose transaminase